MFLAQQSAALIGFWWVVPDIPVNHTLWQCFKSPGNLKTISPMIPHSFRQEKTSSIPVAARVNLAKYAQQFQVRDTGIVSLPSDKYGMQIKKGWSLGISCRWRENASNVNRNGHLNGIGQLDLSCIKKKRLTKWAGLLYKTLVQTQWAECSPSLL